MASTSARKLVLRIQSSDGIKRVEIPDNFTVTQLLRMVGEIYDLPVGDGSWQLFRDRSKTDKSKILPGSQTIKQLGYQNGEMFFLNVSSDAVMQVDPPSTPRSGFSSRQRNDSSLMMSPMGGDPKISSGTPRNSESAAYSEVVEDEVDQQLWQQDGRIQRPRDERMCKHGPSGKCIHCIPIEPFDEEYLRSREPPIKHMSFHAYLRQVTSGASRGKFAALDDISCRIKPGCPNHPPYPEGICTKCQPSAVTLNRQRYRHVDNIMFENGELVNRFLDYWRKTGLQRIGVLYGRYEQHKDVPLGIRATVAAIYEPPQNNSENSIEIREDPNGDNVDALARKLNLRRVGWIFTDLVPEDVRAGTVRCLRNKDTYFLTAEECITAGIFQCQHPSPCRLSPSGQFGSKFVTVVVTGDQSSQIHFEGYQVSDQCMSLARDNCLVPTYDAPELAYVKESTAQQYVPDVFYKEKDKYGNEVTRPARPLPVEYLIVDLPASMPREAQYTFRTPQRKAAFAVENRLDEKQDLASLVKYVSQFRSPGSSFLDAISDFHVLLFMATTEEIILTEDDLDLLVAAVMSQDRDIADTWVSESVYWKNVVQSLERQGNHPSDSHTNGLPELEPDQWYCKHCTVINSGPQTNCSLCGLPQN